MVVYEAIGGSKSPSRTIPPGTEVTNRVFVPRTQSERQNERAPHFGATTEGRTVAFCADLTYAQLESLNWRVRISVTGPCA